MRFHILSLVHTQLTKEYISCAYTTKARRFCDMMTSLGHETYVYAGEECEADVTELVTIYSKAKQTKWFGKFDYHTGFFPLTWDPNDRHWKESNYATIREIEKRLQPDDIICVIAGECQKQVAEAFPNNPVVEYGIGYRGSFANFRVFESYAHMHWVYGDLLHSDNGRHYDCVIPNYFDPSEFTSDLEREDYYVFLGRFIARKGVEIAAKATEKLGAKLIMAGQGCTQRGNSFIGSDIVIQGDHISHIGHVDVEQKAILLGKAKACFMPTTYLEPFGGVAVEALLSGTPVIASDFGAFTEIVRPGIDGYRFRTIGEAARFASDDILAALPTASEIAANTAQRYSTEVIKHKYDAYFEQVLGAFRGDGDFYSDWSGYPLRYAN
jgi:glycosyltransferase involved in cell wall biosynthesis